MSFKYKEFIRTRKLAEGIAVWTIQSEELKFVLQDELINYLHTIGSDAHNYLVNLLNELLEVDRLKSEQKSLIRICFCHSAYVCGMEEPSIDKMDDGKQVYVAKTDRRKLQKILALFNFCEKCSVVSIMSWFIFL